MSGNHNMYCSGNQPDIVQRLRDADWNDNNELFSMAADTIEFLRQQLAKRPRIDEPMLKGATDTAAMIVNELRQRLAECERERDKALQDFKDVHEDYQSLGKELHKVAMERDELMTTMRSILNISLMDKGNWAKTIEAEAFAALAKLGADKTGEV